jgi:restriction system protein
MGLFDFLLKGRAQPEDATLDWLRGRGESEFLARLTKALRGVGYSIDRDGMKAPGADLSLRRRGERTWLCYRHWKARRVGVGPVRALHRFSQEDGAAGCKLVTCGRFSGAALEFAKGKAVELIDGRTLLATLPAITEAIEFDTVTRELDTSFVVERAQAPGVAATQTTERSAPASTAPLPDPSPVNAPSCPRCGSSMRLRVAAGGSAQGRQFWSCERAPECKGMRPT